MKKPLAPKKLALDSRTLRPLTARELAQVCGGGGSPASHTCGGFTSWCN